jgi:hypothetical protein
MVNFDFFWFVQAAEEARGEKPNPNTALLSAILMFGTFFIAYFLRIFRNSHYLGRNVSILFSLFPEMEFTEIILVLAKIY